MKFQLLELIYAISRLKLHYFSQISQNWKQKNLKNEILFVFKITFDFNLSNQHYSVANKIFKISSDLMIFIGN